MFYFVQPILDAFALRSVVGKSMVKWLWDSLATAPQPIQNKAEKLYAFETTFTRCRSDEICSAEEMSTSRVFWEAILSTTRGEQEDRRYSVSRSEGLAI